MPSRACPCAGSFGLGIGVPDVRKAMFRIEEPNADWQKFIETVLGTSTRNRMLACFFELMALLWVMLKGTQRETVFCCGVSHT